LSQAPRDEVPLAGVLVSMVPFGTAIFAYLVSTYGCPVVRDLGLGVTSEILSSCLAGWAAILISVASGISAVAVVVSGVHRNLRRKILELAGIGSFVCLILMILVVTQFAGVMQYGYLLFNNPVFQQMAGASAEEADKFVRLSIQTGYNAVYGAVFAALSAIGLFWYNSSTKIESEVQAETPRKEVQGISSEDKKYMKQCKSCGSWLSLASESCGSCGNKQFEVTLEPSPALTYQPPSTKPAAESVAPSNVPVAPARLPHPRLSASGAEPTAGKFCMTCGAPLRAHAIFCNKCGSKQ